MSEAAPSDPGSGGDCKRLPCGQHGPVGSRGLRSFKGRPEQSGGDDAETEDDRHEEHQQDWLGRWVVMYFHSHGHPRD